MGRQLHDIEKIYQVKTLKVIINVFVLFTVIENKVQNVLFILKCNICHPESLSFHAFIYTKKNIVDKLDVQPKKGHSFFIEKIHKYKGMKNIIRKYKH